MKILTLLTLILAFSLVLSYDQFNQIYTISGFSCQSYSIIQTTNGGYCVVGSALSSTTFTASYEILRLDSTGGRKWDITGSIGDHSTAFDVASTSDDGCVLVGYKYTECVAPANCHTPLAIKYDSLGVLKWTSLIVGTNGYYAYGITTTSDGKFIIVGTYFIAKIASTNGNVEWFRPLSIYVRLTSVVPLSDGTLVAAGFGSINNDAYSCYFYHFPSDGSSETQANYGGTNDSFCYGITSFSDNKVAIVGETVPSGSSFYDLWLLKIDPASPAVPLFEKNFGIDTEDYGKSVSRMKWDNLAIVGYTQVPDLSKFDIWLLMTNSDGIIIKDIKYKNSEGDYGYHVSITAEESIAISGHTLTDPNTLSFFIVVNHTNLCDPGQVWNSLTKNCNDCSTGTYAKVGDKTSCDSCPSNCQSCPAESGCVQCSPGYGLFTPSGQDSQCFQPCPDGTYLDVSVCKPCPINCLTCSTGIFCTTCKSTFYLDRISAIQQDCASDCRPAYFKSSYGTCDLCISGCLSCPNATSCNSCKPDLALLNKVAGQSECLIDCGYRFYKGPLNTCLPCDFRCLTCTDDTPSSCEVCDTAKFGIIKTGPLSCRCSSEYKTNMELKKCESCSSALCVRCSSDNSDQCYECSTTIARVVYNETSHSCNCAPGTFFDGTMCKGCNKMCLECFGPTNSECMPYKCLAPSYPMATQPQTCNYQCSNPPLTLDPASKTCINLVCHPDCMECIGPLSSNCMKCNDPNKMLLRTSCVTSCPIGTFRRNDTCFECPEDCTSCRSYSDCEECKEGFLLQNGFCVQNCDSGFVSDGVSSCSSCGPSCTTCVPGECLACKFPSFLHKGKCITYDGIPVNYWYTLFNNVAMTSPCAVSCASCTGATSSDCGTCNVENNFIQSGEQCKSAVCGPSTYVLQVPDFQLGGPFCGQCYKTCEECIDKQAGNCTACRIGYFPFNPGNERFISNTSEMYNNSVTFYCKTCEEIDNRYELDKLTRAKCVEKCGDGINLGGVECDDGNRKNGDGCSQDCRIEPGFNCQKQENKTDSCTDYNTPIADLTVGENNGIAVITFSRPMQANNKTYFTKILASINFKLRGVPDDCKVNWTFNSMESKLFKRIEAALVIPCAIEGEKEELIANFSKPQMCKDDNNQTFIQDNASCPLKKLRYLTETEKIVIAAAGNTFGTCNYAAVGISAARYAIQSVALCSFWSLMNLLQMMYYTPIMNIYIPTNLFMFLNNYLASSQMIIPLPFEIPDEWTKQFEQKIDYKHLRAYGLTSYCFLYNLLQQIETWVTIAFTYFVLAFLDKILPEGRFMFVRRLKEDYIYNNVIRVFIESFLDVVFFTIFNLNHIISVNVLQMASYFSSIISAAMSLLFFIICVELTSLPEEDYEDEAFVKPFSTLTEEFKEKEGPFCRGYYVIFMIKRTIFALVLNFALDYPILQLTTVTLVELVMLVLIFIFRFYKEKIDNLINGYHEFVGLAVHGFLLYINYFHMEETDIANKLGWASIGLVMVSALIVWLAIIIPSIKKAYQYCTGRKSATSNPQQESTTVEMNANSPVHKSPDTITSPQRKNSDAFAHASTANQNSDESRNIINLPEAKRERTMSDKMENKEVVIDLKEGEEIKNKQNEAFTFRKISNMSDVSPNALVAVDDYSPQISQLASKKKKKKKKGKKKKNAEKEKGKEKEKEKEKVDGEQ